MNLKKATLTSLFAAIFCTTVFAAAPSPRTSLIYLSGTGSDNMKEWEFFCSSGNNSGKWTKIGVPSCWELQGFGTFQYGIGFYGKPFPEGIADEKGSYRYKFDLPKDLRGNVIELVFEASMTDTEVKINGRKAGEVHRGAFYRFSYDVTDMLNYGGSNLLEVTVSKESTNASVNLAERRADYWNFGGIFRPVFLRVSPPIHIARVAVDGRADGKFTAELRLNRAVQGDSKIEVSIKDRSGKSVARSSAPVRLGGDRAVLELALDNPLLWSAETPNLYTAEFTLVSAGGSVLHLTTERFGFRTIEVRESDGLYVNGAKVNIRGVNRHSFRPESGRALSRAANLEDVKLMRSMNMNSVRMSHYPPDPEFLEICDSLGLYVMNELGGWHGKYDTPTGQKLIKSMVERDVNHPSVIWWSNGNEKGWNTELDGEFHKYDPQKRPVLHPQGNFSGFETMHYRSYGESGEYMRLPEIFMPTEFLHGLYDGGHGAGLWDYWEMMYNHPRTAGGFLWVLADEGVKRVDKGGFIDNQGNYGADGIVGPHHEKEGSYYTIKEIWSPIRVVTTDIGSDFDGKIGIENRYDFLNANTCRIEWSQAAFPSWAEKKKGVTVLKSGTAKPGDIPARTKGVVDLGTSIDPRADVLYLKVIDKNGEELWRYSLAVSRKNATAAQQYGAKADISEDKDYMYASVAGRKFVFSKTDGRLAKVEAGGRTFDFGSGPRFIAARRADRSLDQFFNHDDPDAKRKDRTYAEFPDKGIFEGFEVDRSNGAVKLISRYKLGNMQRIVWNFSPEGVLGVDFAYTFTGVVDIMGIMFDYPEDKMMGKKWVGAGPYRVWQNRLHGTVSDLWETAYNDPIPGETFTYPEFKGYFANVRWMELATKDGAVTILNHDPKMYIGVYQPRDGRDVLLYTLPQSGISVLSVIPPVRNKVNATDLCGPSSQPAWVSGTHAGSISLDFGAY